MFSEPAVGERFFGREEVLELLDKRALALKDGYRQNIALTGQSLAGKSSIILHFLHTIREEGFIPIYVEVVKEPFRLFANKFIATLLYNALSKRGHAVDCCLENLIDDAQATLPKTAQALKRVNGLIDDGELEEAYSNLLGLTSVLKEETGTPCIVILDEFDNLEHLGIKNPFLGFGKVIMVQKDTMYIVSSSRNTAINKIISEKLSLLFGNFEVIKVSNFGTMVSRRFIDTALAGFEMSDFVKKFLITFTDGNPFYLDKIISSMRTIATERATNHIDTSIMAESMLETVYKSDGSIHQYLTSYMLDLLDSKNRDLHIAILTTIAGNNNRLSGIAKTARAKQTDVLKACGCLIEKALISKNGGFYRIDDVMFGFWLKAVYQRRKEILIDGTISRTDLFRQDILSILESYRRELETPIISRVAGLFSSFSNELVEIDTKTVRLPHFTSVEIRKLDETNRFIAAFFRENLWVVQPFEQCVGENDIVNFIRAAKSLDCKISNKVIVPLKGIDENARLLAKELRIAIWGSQTINMLLSLYGKKRIVIL